MSIDSAPPTNRDPSPGEDRDPVRPATAQPSLPAILLLGHGSHVDGRSSDSVHELARELKTTGRYPEVRVAFWKEEPQLRHAFLLVESPRVVAVPFFTSEGYFTDRVLPRELRIEPPVSSVRRVAGPRTRGPSPPDLRSGAEPDEIDAPIRVHYTRAVGAHPAMGDAVLERALDRLREEELLEPDGAPPADVTLVVLGHGTERHPASGEVVEGITERLSRESAFRRVTCCFLDQDPRMLPVLESVSTARAVMVPFFMAEGWHVGQTIPRDLDLEGGRSRVGETEVLFTDPVGTHPAVAWVVGRMVAEAVGDAVGDAVGGSLESNEADEQVETPRRASLPARARRAFLAWIDSGEGEGRTFLQTRVRRTRPPPPRAPTSAPSGPAASGDASERETPLYEIRHVADRSAPREELERSGDPEWARSVAERTGDGRHRPLKTAPDLRRGWLLEDLGPEDLWEAYTHLYPAAPVHWYLGRRDALPVIPFRETASRQSGIYAVVAEMDDAGVTETLDHTCRAGCLRRIRWPLEEGREAPSDGSQAPGEGEPKEKPDEPEEPDEPGEPEGPEEPGTEVPCPEPCSFFITRARERIEDQRRR